MHLDFYQDNTRPWIFQCVCVNTASHLHSILIQIRFCSSSSKCISLSLICIHGGELSLGNGKASSRQKEREGGRLQRVPSTMEGKTWRRGRSMWPWRAIFLRADREQKTRGEAIRDKLFPREALPVRHFLLDSLHFSLHRFLKQLSYWRESISIMILWRTLLIKL